MEGAAKDRGVWQRGGGGNLIGIPTGFFASTAFNAMSPRVHIAGVRETNIDLFRRLAEAGSVADAADIFVAYTTAMFGLAAELRRDEGKTSPGATTTPLICGCCAVGRTTPTVRKGRS